MNTLHHGINHTRLRRWHLRTVVYVQVRQAAIDALGGFGKVPDPGQTLGLQGA